MSVGRERVAGRYRRRGEDGRQPAASSTLPSPTRELGEAHSNVRVQDLTGVPKLCAGAALCRMRAGLQRRGGGGGTP